MDRNRLQLFRRTVCAVCAFALGLALAGPAAFAANEATPAETELTQAQAAEMAQADAALDQLLDSGSYAAMTVDERQAAAPAPVQPPPPGPPPAHWPPASPPAPCRAAAH